MTRKLALVTGAASGLGLEFCRLLAGGSFDLIMVDKDEGGLERAAASIQDKYGTRTEVIVKDLGVNGAADELKGSGVTCSVLLPGLFNTNFASSAARNSGSPVKKEKIVTTTVEQVALTAMRGMMKGKIRIIPGFSNKLLALAPRILPRNLVLSGLRRIQERIREAERA